MRVRLRIASHESIRISRQRMTALILILSFVGSAIANSRVDIAHWFHGALGQATFLPTLAPWLLVCATLTLWTHVLRTAILATRWSGYLHSLPVPAALHKAVDLLCISALGLPMLLATIYFALPALPEQPMTTRLLFAALLTMTSLFSADVALRQGYWRALLLPLGVGLFAYASQGLLTNMVIRAGNVFFILCSLYVLVNRMPRALSNAAQTTRKTVHHWELTPSPRNRIAVSIRLGFRQLWYAQRGAVVVCCSVALLAALPALIVLNQSTSLLRKVGICAFALCVASIAFGSLATLLQVENWPSRRYFASLPQGRLLAYLGCTVPPLLLFGAFALCALVYLAFIEEFMPMIPLLASGCGLFCIVNLLAASDSEMMQQYSASLRIALHVAVLVIIMT